VSKEYDPNCMVSYVAGMIQMMKATGDNDYFSVIMGFLNDDIDFVDKGVITEVVDFGINFTNDFDTAAFVARITHDMLLRDIQINECQPSDGRTAYAIRAGLIEMCLSLIERFGGHESFVYARDCDEESLFDILRDTIENVHNISLHMKSAKAIRSKRNCIEERS